MASVLFEYDGSNGVCSKTVWSVVCQRSTSFDDLLFPDVLMKTRISESIRKASGLQESVAISRYWPAM